MRVWLKSPRARKITVTLLLLVVLAFLWVIFTEILDKPSAVSLARVLVLDDADDDFRALRPKDCVYAFANGKMIQKVAGLNICQTVGGGISLSAAANGQFFVV